MIPQFLVQSLISSEVFLLLFSLVVSVFLERITRKSLPLFIMSGASFLGILASLTYFSLFNGQQLIIVAPHSALWLSLRLDAFSAVFFLLINIVAFCATWFAVQYTEHLDAHIERGRLHAETGTFIIGMLGTVLSGTPAAFFLFWELMSVASFLLVLTEKTEASVRAALFYFVMTQFGALAIVIGFALAFGDQLFVPFSQISLSGGALYLAFFLFFIGFGAKAGLVPLHTWLPLAHPEAPSHISALMSGAMLKVALFGFLLMLSKFSTPLPPVCGAIVIAVGLISALYGAVKAITEKDIKTMLAWSSIENIGLLFVMIGTAIYADAQGASLLALAALGTTLFMALNHALFKSGLFFSAGVLFHKLGTRNIDNMGGLAQRMPFFSKTMLLLSLSAAALPPAGAFMGEWVFLRALYSSFGVVSPTDKTLYVAIFACVGLIGGLGVFVMIRYVGIAFLGRSRGKDEKELTEPSMFGEIAPIGMAALGTFALGVFAPWMLKTLLIAGSGLSFGGVSSLTSLTYGSLSVSALFLFVVFMAFVIDRLLIAPRKTVSVDTWDCGQPITARMEYTGTGFAAPIRFFFLSLLQSKKTIMRKPIIATNARVQATSMTIIENPLFDRLFYAPIRKMVAQMAQGARRFHRGLIGAYFSIIGLTIVVSLILGLWLT